MIEVIKNVRDINRLGQQILKDYSYKHYAYFILCVNTGLLRHKAIDLRWDDIITEKKISYIILSGKAHDEQVFLNNNCMSVLKKLRKIYPDEKWVFQSAKAITPKPWSYNYAYVFLNKSAKNLKLDLNIGTHTLRKTFGYHAIKSTNWTLLELSNYFGQYSVKRTKKYIHWDKEPVKKINSFAPPAFDSSMNIED